MNVIQSLIGRPARLKCGLGILCALALSAPPLVAESVVNSKHNLSVGGPGTIRASSETQVCIFCHTPHNSSGDAPLWNRYASAQTYQTYDSSTTKASIGQPTGASKLCLSCHDGTIALGMVRSRSSDIPFSGGVYNLPPGRSRIGTDLRDDHPISFTYDAQLASDRGELRDPSLLTGDVQLMDGELQCTSCHDPHDDAFGNFLVRDNQASALCTTCHVMTDWSGSAHQASAAVWNGTGTDPWPNTEETTVADNACANCHAPHAAGSAERLLNLPGEEPNCYVCHNSNVATHDIESEFSKLSVHPIDATVGVHDPVEDLVNPATRHVECSDCHNPHAAESGTAAAPGVPGPLNGVAGMDEGGASVDPIVAGYQLCFRCHADSTDRGSAHVNRATPQTNTRLEFDPSNASYHPVVAAGANPNVPSLIGPLTESSLIACTDCHANNQGPGAGGSGPRGPHGSAYEPILERRLELADGSTESSAVYALCYKCHSRSSILADIGFSEHKKHVEEEDVACTTCHDPHGVSGATHLINFNLDYVTPFGGTIEFVDEGFRAGNCTLTCHGEDHEGFDYGP